MYITCVPLLAPKYKMMVVIVDLSLLRRVKREEWIPGRNEGDRVKAT